MYRYVTKVRFVCAVNVIETNIPKEKWVYNTYAYPFTEYGAQKLADDLDNVTEDDNVDKHWLEYYVPMDDEWCKACDLPALCTS